MLVVELLELFDQRNHQFLCGGFQLFLRHHLLVIQAVLREDLPVVGPRGELCEANGCPLGEHAPLAEQLLVVGIDFVVLLSHARHPQCALLDEVLQQLHIALELLKIRVLLNLFEVGELHDLVVVDLDPQLLYSLVEHVVVLGEVLDAVLELSDVRLASLHLLLQLRVLLLQFGDVAVLLLRRVLLVEEHLIA